MSSGFPKREKGQTVETQVNVKICAKFPECFLKNDLTPSQATLRDRLYGFDFFLAVPPGMWDLPQPGIEPVPPTLGARRSLNHWTAREVLVLTFKNNLAQCLA